MFIYILNLDVCSGCLQYKRVSSALSFDCKLIDELIFLFKSVSKHYKVI
jgi:hypothetical protein